MDNFKHKKKYGQNFLKDTSIVSRIVSISGITKNDLVLEVGPGKGILTKELAKCSKEVISYEIDEELRLHLDTVKDNFDNIYFIYDDFLNREIKKDIKDITYQNIYFISNVPYYITTPILMKLMDSNILFSKIIMMVQKEVGNRFSAKPKSKNYSSITVYLNYYYDVVKEFNVDRNKFTPSPNVDSCIVSLTRKKKLIPLKNKDYFFQLVRDSFQFKRKNIKNNLKNYDSEIVEEVLIKNGYQLTSRAEELPLDVFIELSNTLLMK